MSESSNPAAGRPGGSRSYGDAQTAVRPAPAASAPTGSAVSAPSPTSAPAAPTGPAVPGLGASGLGASSGSNPLPPAPDATDSRRSGSGGSGSGSSGTGPLSGASDGVGRALSGAGRSFARVGAAIGSATQESRPSNRPGSAVSPQARVRKARLRVARVDPWSVMKVSFVLSIAMGIVTIVGTAVVWNVLNALGVFTSLNKTVGDLTSSGTGTGSTSSFNLSSFLSFGHVEGYMMIIALVDVVLATALATLGSYLYNLAAGFVGGFEVTLAEDQ